MELSRCVVVDPVINDKMIDEIQIVKEGMAVRHLKWYASWV